MANEVDRFLSTTLGAVNKKVFEYVNRAALAGVIYQASQIIDSWPLKLFGQALFFALFLQVWADNNLLIDHVAGKMGSPERKLLKIIAMVVILALAFGASMAMIMVMNDISRYFMSANQHGG